MSANINQKAETLIYQLELHIRTLADVGADETEKIQTDKVRLAEKQALLEIAELKSMFEG